MKKIAVVFGVVFLAVVAVTAQRAARTVTNADLERYREKRLASEQEYRNNYQRLGMPSPEELDAIRDRDMDARLQLAEQIRQARLEKERLALERERIGLETDRLAFEREVRETEYVVAPVYGGIYGGFGYFDSGYGYGFGDRFRGRRQPYAYPYWPSYRITPTGVIFEPGSRSGNIWSPVPVVPNRPAWRRPGIVVGPRPRR